MCSLAVIKDWPEISTYNFSAARQKLRCARIRLMSPGKKSLQIGGKVWTIFATFRVGEALYDFSQKELYRAFWKLFHGFY